MVKGYTIARPVTQPDKTGRARAARLHPGEPCDVCGMPYGGRGRVQRHHRDSDRMNNDRSNIAFLCVQHHKDAHAASDRAVGEDGGARPRVAAMMADHARLRAIEARSRLALGATVSEVAAAFDVTPHSVKRWLRKYAA